MNYLDFDIVFSISVMATINHSLVIPRVNQQTRALCDRIGIDDVYGKVTQDALNRANRWHVSDLAYQQRRLQRQPRSLPSKRRHEHNKENKEE